MTLRERRLARKYSDDHYKKKKNIETTVLPENPPRSDVDEPPQKNSGRKKVRRDRSKLNRENRKLINENRLLRKSRNKYKTRWFRVKQQKELKNHNSSQELTPQSKVNQIMASNDKTKVARRILFAEAFETQLKSNLKSITCNKTKYTVISKLLGNKEVLKKYRVVKDVKRIMSFKPARYSVSNNRVRKQRNEVLYNRIRNGVRDFLEDDENSRMAPGKKDCITRKKVKKQKRYLNDNLNKLHSKFLNTHSYNVSYSFFCKLRPFWVVYQKLQDRDTCQCKRHANSDFVVSTLNKDKIINKKTAKEVAEELVCEGYNVKCLMRECPQCSEKTVSFNEFDGDLEVCYFAWVQQKEHFKDKTGKLKSVTNIVKLQLKTTAYELANKLLKVMTDFMAHEAVIKHQYTVLKYLRHNLKENEVLLHIDFSENYSLKYSEEIQSFHFGGSRKQVTLHTCSLEFRENPYDSIKVKSFCTISEDIKHDPPAVFAHLQPVFCFLKTAKPELKVIHFLSDSPSTQYRNKSIFYMLAHFLGGSFPKLEYSSWNYLEAGHGKGKPDGIGGTVKRTADRLVNEGKDVATFETLVKILQDNLRSIEIKVITHKDISDIRDKIDQRLLVTFKGTMQVHQVVYIPKEPGTTTTLWMKSMSCFRCFYEKKNIFDEKKQFKCQHHKLGCLQYTTKDSTTSKDKSKLQFKKKENRMGNCNIAIQPAVLCKDRNYSAAPTASFYGASYVSVPLPDAKSTTEVQLRFRTKQSDALLFLAAGRTDYCLIRLESGRLKVLINLGAGESEVSSPKGLRLNDLAWHNVLISRIDANMTLYVDQIHVTREKLPGRFFELNIHYGLYVGGQGEFSELFLGHGEWLRGCLSDVLYNGVDVLQRARHRILNADAQSVTWNCAAEFDASDDKEISFVEDGAYMALPNIIPRTGAKWQFEMKTVSDHGVVFYTSGMSSGRSDFVGVELVNGQLRIALNKGNGAVELKSDMTVSDGDWHAISVQFTASFIEISVDGQKASMKLAQGGSKNKFFDLAETIHIGGIELNKRARALSQGLKAADTSFKGCLRSIDVDGRRLGISHARVTQGILPECVWMFPCIQQPCASDATCVQQGVDDFRCECQRAHCIKEDFATSYKVFSKSSLLELVELSPLHVSEGENALITPSHMNVILDYAKYGVRDSGVLFSTVGSPQHGRLAVEVWERGGGNPSQQVFTLLDLAKDKVRYLHDGSESLQDSITLELELAPGAGFVLPGYLQGTHRFVLHVDISPINDSPILVIPTSKVLRLAQGTRKKLSRDLVNATDQDNSPDMLVYSVLGGNSGDGGGHIERNSVVGEAITTFTQAEVDEGLIVYAHTSKIGNTKLTFQVSDGIETSAAAFLRISVYPLVLRLENNTGAILTYNSWVRITPLNLSFTTNADDPSLQIQYQIVTSPQYGWIQRQRTVEDGEEAWQAVEHFTSQQVAMGQVRYVHTQETPSQDMFKFQVSAREVLSTTIYDFRLTFTEIHLLKVKHETLLLDCVSEAVITEKHLLYTTTPLSVDLANLSYEVVGLPKYGTVSVDNIVLHVGDTFTQVDVTQGRVKYKLNRTAYSTVRDGLTFRVSAPQCQALAPTTLLFVHSPPSQLTEKVRLINNVLQVIEGGSQLITPSSLDITITGVSSIEYQLVQGPSNGWIDVHSLDNIIVRNNATLFTAEEVAQQQVKYTHDDSETHADSFQFVAVSTREEDFLLVGKFDISVNLTNDNSPIRSVDRIFHVVKFGERLLTGHNLQYVDVDVDCSPLDITYTVSGSTRGIYSAQSPTTPLFQFTQDDLNNNRVLFRHEVDETETVVDLWVSDGVHHTEGKLEVTASPAYVEIINNTRLVVRQGGAAHITSANLYADTNVNLAQQQIKFEVMNGPSQGVLELNGEVDPVKLFTQDDILEKKLLYRHNGDVTVQDHFELRIFVEGASTRAEFNVRVFPAGYWDPLIVTNNQTFHVEESTSVSMTNKYLQVKQPHVPASDITFLVVESPRYGYLEMEQASPVPDDVKEEPITAFDQATIDSGRLHYVQATANQTKDRMIVDVTNGITWLRGLIVSFLVVPERLYIGGGELRCEEGGNVTLPGSLLPPLTEYYIGRLTEYKLQKAPLYGHFISTSQPTRPLNKWSPQQMQAGIIQYIHNGNESTEDEFVVVAKAGEKESLPAKVRIGIASVNDELPVIVNNTGLTLWQGGSHVLTSSYLAAVDKDTPADNLTFAIVSATAGHVALVSSPDIAIDKFTQSQLNKRQLLFVHSGEKVDGEFDVVISDGVNSAGPVIFHSYYKEPSLRIVDITGLHVFPQLRKPFTTKTLLAVCSDPTRDIIYTITSPPTKGIIVIDSSSRPVTNFTQADVNSSRVWYQHTTPLLTDLSDNDTFLFDVSCPFAESIRNQDFHIDISVWSGGLDQFIDLSYQLTVDEGSSVPLHLNTSLILKFLKQHITSPIVQMKVWNLPEHGLICVQTDCNTTEFTNVQVDAGDVYYTHDHSDTLEDRIMLSLYLSIIPGEVLLCNVTVRVRVNPINDQPFKLITQSPHASVVQGQKRTITKLDLQTEDEDTPADEIVYEIISGPNHGALSVAGNSTVGSFTQADIDTGRVKYEHSGPLQPASFYFRVSDNHFNPAYTLFKIEVIPATLNVSVSTPVLLQQGSSVAVITAGVFLINTNGREENVKYNITTPPHNGAIYLDDDPVMVFRQSDLIARRVMYLQKDLTKHSDVFELSASLPLENSPLVKGLLVNVSVEPLLKMGKFLPVSGMKTKLTTDAIDASPLAKLTSSDPVFVILRKPKYGKIKKIIRTSGERRNMREKEIARFSHEEIRSGVIYYVAKKGTETVKDSFPFLLSGNIFQPAIGEMRFEVIGEAGYPPTTMSPPKPPRLPGPKPPIGYEGVEIASPNMSDDYLLVVSMVAGTIVLAIIVVILVRCGSKRAENSDGIKNNLNAPLPLPRPPDDLMPSSPHPKRSGPPLTPGSIPQCKVIPLGPTIDSVTGSEPELNLRYPYGAADEDWSSYEASELGYPQRANNPMLRRNQYWV